MTGAKDTWTSHDGSVTLYLGDCLEILPYLPKVDAVVTDPPYGRNALDGSRTARIYGINRGDNWDCSPPPAAVFPLMLDLSDHQIVWGYNYFASSLGETKCFLVWNKPSMSGMHTMAFGELAYTSFNGPAKIYTGESEKTNRLHPTQKPPDLMRWCVSFLPERCMVLDPFTGSGATGVACVRTGRKFIGIEIEPKYFEIAKKRIDAETRQYKMFEG